MLKTRQGGPLPAFDRMAGGHPRLGAGRLDRAVGHRRRISAVLLMALVCAAFVGFIAASASARRRAGSSAGLLGFWLPFSFLRVKRTRRLRAFEEQFPEALDLLSRALKAGHAFATGLKMVADEMPEPVGPEFRKTFDEQNFGLPLKDALPT